MITLHAPFPRFASVILAAWVLSHAAESAEMSPLPPLVSVPGPRLPGKFVWADLVTDDLAAARTFYGQLFGWSFRDLGGYTIGANEARPLCGLVQRPRPGGQPDARPRWFGYLSVASVERAERAVTNAGGRVLAAPKKLPSRGEQAVFADAEGAVFGVIKSSAGDPKDFLPEPGDWVWIQLLSRDGRKAAAFYREVGGYKVVENTTANRLSDFVLTSKGYARATVRTIPKDQEKVRPTWLPFVRVNNVGESVAKARVFGGAVLVEPKPEFLEGKVAVVADPTGAAIGLLELTDRQLNGGR